MPEPVVVQGVVNADGTLKLEGGIALPPGPVRITVQPEGPAAGEDWWQYLQRCRAELEAAGVTFRRGEDIEAEVEQLRGDSDGAEAVYWEQEWLRHHGDAPGC